VEEIDVVEEQLAHSEHVDDAARKMAIERVQTSTRARASAAWVRTPPDERSRNLDS